MNNRPNEDVGRQSAHPSHPAYMTDRAHRTAQSYDFSPNGILLIVLALIALFLGARHLVGDGLSENAYRDAAPRMTVPGDQPGTAAPPVVSTPPLNSPADPAATPRQAQ